MTLHYGPPLSIDTKKVPVVLYLTSQGRFNDVRVSKNRILQIYAKSMLILNIRQKS